MRETIRGWRFYDQFRTDAESPIRLPQLGTSMMVLHHDGHDLAAALPTIMSMIDYKSAGLVELQGFPTLVDIPLMRLDAPFLVELRELVVNNDASQLANLSFSKLTIGAVVELACIRASTNGRFRVVFDGWAKSSPHLINAFQVFEQWTLPSTADMWAVRKVDFSPVRGPNWSDDRNYHPFESRFTKAAREAGSAAARLCDRPDGPTAIGYGGARGGGKSHRLLAQMGADDCQRVPGLKCLMLRKVGKANLENFEDLRRRLFGSLRHEFSAHRGVLTFANGSRIIAGHFQTEKDIDA